MQLKMDVKSSEWWFWTVTLALIIAAVAGWTPGYAAVMLVSAVHLVVFAIRSGSVVSFPSQVRIAYFAYTLLGLWEAGRVYIYALLIVGTAMVVFFDRCGIALALKLMPWNRSMENPRCKLPGGEGGVEEGGPAGSVRAHDGNRVALEDARREAHEERRAEGL